MKWFVNLKIAKKLGASFGFLLVIMAGLGALSIVQLSRVNASTLETEGIGYARWASNQLRADASAFNRYELIYLLESADGRKSLQDKMASRLSEIKQDEMRDESLISSPEEKQLSQEFQDRFDAYIKVHDEVLRLADEKKEAAARQLCEKKGIATFDAAMEVLQKDIELKKAGSKAAAERAADLYSRSRYWVGGLVMAAVALGLFLVVFIGRMVARPLGRTVERLKDVAEGDLTKRLVVESKDEMGELGQAFNTSMEKLHGVVSKVAENVQLVAHASEEFSASSQQISSNSEETSAQTSTVSAATEQVSRNLQTVATGAEEMSATIREVAKNAGDAARVAGEAVKTAETATLTVSKLGESSVQIGQVVKVITSIAQQTNLLALNATIEAARAGEAGKGFAVVANEVKELAKQTAKATEDIGQRIAAIQDDTKNAVQAIDTISGIINQVNGISTTIATAVEEQSATTNEMTRNVTEAAKGASEIAQNIHGMAEAARNTSTTAQESQKAAAQLAEMSTQLRNLVDQFKIADGSGENAGIRGQKAMSATAGN